MDSSENEDEESSDNEEIAEEEDNAYNDDVSTDEEDDLHNGDWEDMPKKPKQTLEDESMISYRISELLLKIGKVNLSQVSGPLEQILPVIAILLNVIEIKTFHTCKT